MLGNDVARLVSGRAEPDRVESGAVAPDTNLSLPDLGMLVHDLRTPLIAILGFNQHQMIVDDAETRADCARKIDIAGRYLLDLVNDILTLSKAESGKMEVRQVRVDSMRLLQDCISVVSTMSRAKTVPVALEVAPDFPAEFVGDPQKLRQVLINLLSNAVKFTERGVVTLRARPDLLSGMICFAVEDSGTGMTPDQVSGLFQPFHQCGRQVERQNGGTGLGLAISRSMARAMGGEITVSSTPGVGSQFCVNLPRSLRSAEAIADYPAPHRVWPANIPAGPPRAGQDNILVVDDGALMRDLFSALLTRQGYRVRTACSGSEALQIIARERFDVVLLDQHMDDMDGPETAQRIRKMESVAQPLIIGLTANVTDDNRAAARAAGMDEYLCKTTAPAELARHLHNLQHQRQGANGATR